MNIGTRLAHLIPPCGENQRLNAAIHGALAVGYGIVVSLEIMCLAYHAASAVRHWRDASRSARTGRS